MHMFGHDDISGDKEAVPLSHLFQLLLEDAVAGSSCEKRLSSITTEGEEVEVACVVIADQASGHDGQMLHRAMGHGQKSKGKNKGRDGFCDFPPCPNAGQGRAPTFAAGLEKTKGGPPAQQKLSNIVQKPSDHRMFDELVEPPVMPISTLRNRTA